MNEPAIPAVTEEAMLLDLYFDLEKINTLMSEIHDRIVAAGQIITKIYVAENQELEKGRLPEPRPPFDIATRAALSSSISLMLPQIAQIGLSIHLSQRSCTVFCPALQKTNSTAQ